MYNVLNVKNAQVLAVIQSSFIGISEIADQKILYTSYINNISVHNFAF